MSLELAQLKAERRLIWHRVKWTHSILVQTRELANRLEKRYLREEGEYEECDRKLALLDGRFERCQAALAAADVTNHGKRKSKPAPDLTDEQVTELCSRLGVKLPEEEKEDEDED